MQREVVTMSIDPGKEIGVAVLGGQELWWMSSGVIVDAKQIRATMKAVCKRIHKRVSHPSAVRFVVEQQYIGRGGPQVALQISRGVGAWMYEAELRGFTLMSPVLTSTWRSTFGLGARRIKDKKQAAVDMVWSMFEESVNHNLAEAILLGVHVHRPRLGAEPAWWTKMEEARCSI
jgi:hypothetical protein